MSRWGNSSLFQSRKRGGGRDSNPRQLKREQASCREEKKVIRLSGRKKGRSTDGASVPSFMKKKKNRSYREGGRKREDLAEGEEGGVARAHVIA